MRTTPQALGLTPSGSVYAGVLHRPWSAPVSVRRARYQGLRGFFVGLAMGGLTVGLAAAGFAEGGFTDAAPVPEPVSAAVVGDPPCGFDVYRGELSVTSLTARGDVHVWLRGRDVEIRKVRPIRRGQTLVWQLKRAHSSADFQVAVTATGRRHGDEQVSWCEPA